MDPKSKEAFEAKGRQVYEKIKAQLEKNSPGEIVAIEPESGEYFVGKTLGQANDLAFAKYPDKWMYFVRIGSPEAAIALQTW
ncbi:MAG: hypothetical protein H5T64_08155 [Chloroflexi bacterium]|nr:hypothetical protein [Chloroflexota bacterium]